VHVVGFLAVAGVSIVDERMAKLMTTQAETAFREAIEAIEKVSAVEVVVAVRPQVQRWLVPHIVIGVIAMLATLAFQLFSEDYEFELWTILLMPAFAALAGGLLVEAIPPLTRAVTPARIRDAAVDTAARAAFVELGVHATKGRTGLLVLIAIHERRVALVGDLALVERVGEASLIRRAHTLETALPDGGEAVAAALAKLADDFAAALPRDADDVNELPDIIQIRGTRRFRGRAA
jgi:putative membrane protein